MSQIPWFFLFLDENLGIKRLKNTEFIQILAKRAYNLYKNIILYAFDRFFVMKT